jgi:hypothetical protein
MNGLRIPKPNFEDPVQISMAANNILTLFGIDLSNKVEYSMKGLLGDGWLNGLAEQNDKYKNFNVRDMTSILKDLTRNGQSVLRLPLLQNIEKREIKTFFDALDDVLGERNAWVHRQVNSDKSEFCDLVQTILTASRYLELEIVRECENLLKAETSLVQEIIKPIEEVSIDMVEPVIPVVAAPTAVTVIEPIASTASDEQPYAIGTPIALPMLSHSYVLRLNGAIEDRATGKSLSEVNPKAAEMYSPLLLSRKPSGGRIRITKGGILCAFIDDNWGFLAQVEAKDWFPGHLN